MRSFRSLTSISLLRLLHYAILFATLYMATSCAPVQGAQLDTPRTEARGYFAEGALYSCSGVLMGMGGLMGLDVTLEVQTVALGICSIYAELPNDPT